MNGTPQRPNDTYRVRAFAAVVQAAVLVTRIAHDRDVDGPSMLALIDAIFATDLDDPDRLFADLTPWTVGLKSALALLGRPSPELADAAKHAVTVMQIALDLRKHGRLSAQLRKEIETLDAERASMTADELMLALGAVYQRTLSTLPRRVHVTGDPAVLQRPAVAGRIRALLLGGVRAAWLWHSLGGRRWHLLLKRTTMRRALQISLDEHNRPPLRH